jgi:single-strand DNA-binding protein
MNILTAIGNLGRDCELRFTAKKEPVASFSFALQSGYGENRKTTWLECSLWGKQAETLTPMLLKGTQVGLTGEFSIREYQDKDGNLKTSPSLNVRDVTLLGKKELSAPKEAGKANGHQPQPLDLPELPDGFDDDAPF